MTQGRMYTDENILAGKFGLLKPLRCFRDERKQKKWVCLCDCGKETVVFQTNLTRLHTRSCGCERYRMIRKALLKHDMCGTKIYRTWSGMHRRCYTPSASPFRWYGARGIKVCERWHTFLNFYADMGDHPDGMELDRIDSDGDYSPENCRWLTHIENVRNARPALRVKARERACVVCGQRFIPRTTQLREGQGKTCSIPCGRIVGSATKIAKNASRRALP